MTATTRAPTLALSGWRHHYSGKVRDLYLPEVAAQPADAHQAAAQPADAPHPDVVLVVASDRMSAFDHVLSTPVPDKGAVLTALSLWWFDQVADIIDNHLLPDQSAVPGEVAGRAILCRRLEMVPIECVARGYLAGSGTADYLRDGAVCGVALPEGLVEGSRLPEPIFTPAAKAPFGEHDANIDLREVGERVGERTATELRDLTLALYRRAERIARERGVILADTKFEFGRAPDGGLVLADEVFTPDSSRFWPVDGWAPGGPQPSFDKQFVRDWLTSPAAGWDRHGDLPPPPLPPDVVDRTRLRYIEAYERLTGRAWTTPHSSPDGPSGRSQGSPRNCR